MFKSKNTVLGLPISNGENVNGINNVAKANMVESYLHNFSKEEYKNNFFNLKTLISKDFIVKNNPNTWQLHCFRCSPFRSLKIYALVIITN